VFFDALREISAGFRESHQILGQSFQLVGVCSNKIQVRVPALHHRRRVGERISGIRQAWSWLPRSDPERMAVGAPQAIRMNRPTLKA
jgi:hypothetical protein